MDIIIKKENINNKKNYRYRGMGMVSCNNSSRLLMDYKYENPDKYWEILNLAFGNDGLSVGHLKIEMGADINSSSGTEPSVKRRKAEPADVRRGMGFMLAADAKKINPELKLDMLWWSEPRWVSDEQDCENDNHDKLYQARYQWYREILCEAYKVYGLRFDYVSANRNERPVDTEWIKYLSKCLKNDEPGSTPYDFTKIKIVAADEDCKWDIADEMIKNEELRDAVDVIGVHYTSWSTANAQKLKSEYQKELWVSEGSAAMSDPEDVCRFDLKSHGMAGKGGILDIAVRILTMFAEGGMTLYEFQPLVAAYYDGVTYCHKQIIDAAWPWCGKYKIEPLYYVLQHFTKFIKKDWCIMEKESIADGKPTQDGHSVENARTNVLVTMDPDGDNYSIIMINTEENEKIYDIDVSNVDIRSVNVWETNPAGVDQIKNSPQNIKSALFYKKGKLVADDNKIRVKIAPFSIITVTSLENVTEDTRQSEDNKSGILKLPYFDDFTYSNYNEEYLAERGRAPRYMTDLGGAFEVHDEGVLMQMITPDLKAEEWGTTPEPVTCMGDDRWFNYSVSIKGYIKPVTIALKDTTNVEKVENVAPAVMSEKDEISCEGLNYIGAGLRYNLADIGQSGYWIQLYENGDWKLNCNADEVMHGSIGKNVSGKWSALKICAINNTIEAYINNKKVGVYVVNKSALCTSGRAAIYSAYENNGFTELEIMPEYFVEKSEKSKEIITEEKSKEIITEEKSKEIIIEEKSKEIIIEEKSKEITRKEEIKEITRKVNDTSYELEYNGEWDHDFCGSFRNYKRTMSYGKPGSQLSFEFAGEGFMIAGQNESSNTEIEVIIDEMITSKRYILPETWSRGAAYHKFNMPFGNHKVTVTVLKGIMAVDFIEIL